MENNQLTISPKPLISIIVPIYNQEEYIAKGIESLLNQTYKNLQIILVNDGSTDRSLQICEQYSKMDNRIIVVDTDNKGVSYARNLGLIMAKGDYIGFMDGDDFVFPQMYEKLMDLILANGTDIATCSYRRGEQHILGPNGLLPVVLFLTENITYLSVCSKLFSRSILHGIRFNEKLRYAEDLIFCFQALMRTQNIACTSDVYYNYTINPHSATHEKFSKQRLSVLKFYYILKDLPFVKQHPTLKKTLKMHKIYNIIGLLRMCFQDNYENEHLNHFFVTNIQQNLFNYLFTSYPLMNRIFALNIILNFYFTKRIYQFLVYSKLMK